MKRVLLSAVSLVAMSHAYAATELPTKATKLAPPPVQTEAPEVYEPDLTEPKLTKIAPTPEPTPAPAPVATAEKENGLVFDEHGKPLPASVNEADVVPAPAPTVTKIVKEEAPAPAAATTPEEKEKPSSSALIEALTHVYETNPQLLAARERLKVADEGVSLAVSEFRPDAVAGYDKGRQRTAAGGAAWTYGDTSAKGVTVTQPIFSGGGSVASFKAAKDRMKAARADLVAVEQQVLYDALVAYTLVVENESVLKLTQNNVDVLGKQKEASRIRFDVGELTKTDVAQSEARLARAQANERQAVGNLEVAKVNFARVVGYPAPTGLPMPTPPAGLPENIEEATSLAEAANPVLQAARLRESAFKHEIYTRIASILPEVSVQGSMNRTVSGRIPGVSKFDSDEVLLSVSIPLYQSGAEWSRLREARNVAEQARFTSIDTSLAVAEDVSRAWNDYNTAQSLITSNKSAVEATGLALEGVRQENEFGVRTVLDVLDAEQESLDAQVQLVQAERTEKIQAYRLLATVGKLTAQQLALPVKVYDPEEHYDSVKYQLLGW